MKKNGWLINILEQGRPSVEWSEECSYLYRYKKSRGINEGIYTQSQSNQWPFSRESPITLGLETCYVNYGARIEPLSMGAFLWDDPDQDQLSEIAWIIVDQMNRWILIQSGFIGSIDLPWSEWSRITDRLLILIPIIPNERTLCFVSSWQIPFNLACTTDRQKRSNFKIFYYFHWCRLGV